ncbi:MAG: RDD family protein [Pseudobdellovibrionaceae bacterium]
METSETLSETTKIESADPTSEVGVGFFFPRFCALMLDGVFVVTVWVCIIFLVSFFSANPLLDFKHIGDGYVVFLFTPLRTLLFVALGIGQTFLWSYLTAKAGATPGKYLLGLRIVSNETLQNLKFWPAFLRVNIFGYGVMLFSYMIPVSSLYDEKRRHWVDYILKTRVIRLSETRTKAKKYPVLATILIVLSGLIAMASFSKNAESLMIPFRLAVWKGPSKWVFHRDGVQVESEGVGFVGDSADEGEENAEATNEEPPPPDEKSEESEGAVQEEQQVGEEESSTLKRYMNRSLSPTEKQKVNECLKNDLGMTPQMNTAACRCYVINYEPELMDPDTEPAMGIRNELLEMCKNDVLTWSAEAEKGAL